MPRVSNAKAHAVILFYIFPLSAGRSSIIIDINILEGCPTMHTSPLSPVLHMHRRRLPPPFLRIGVWIMTPPLLQMNVRFLFPVIIPHRQAGHFFDVRKTDVGLRAVEDAGNLFERRAFSFDVEEKDEDLSFSLVHCGRRQAGRDLPARQRSSRCRRSKASTPHPPTHRPWGWG